MVLSNAVFDYEDYDTQRSLIRLIPHRHPFLFIDKVLGLDPGKSISCIKNVSNGEDFFVGHFPGNEVMPGVIIVEFMAQSACICALSSYAQSEDRGDLGNVLLTGIEEAKFKSVVRPGTVIRAEISLFKSKYPLFIFKGKVFDHDKGVLVASACIRAIHQS